MKPSKINIPKIPYNSERQQTLDLCVNNYTDRSDGTRNVQNQLNSLSNAIATNKDEQNKKEIHFYRTLQDINYIDINDKFKSETGYINQKMSERTLINKNNLRIRTSSKEKENHKRLSVTSHGLPSSRGRNNNNKSHSKKQSTAISAYKTATNPNTKSCKINCKNHSQIRTTAISPGNRLKKNSTSHSKPCITHNNKEEIEKYRQKSKMLQQLTESMQDKLEKSNTALQEVLEKANEYKTKYKEEQLKNDNLQKENDILKKQYELEISNLQNVIKTLEADLSNKKGTIDLLNKHINDIEIQNEDEVFNLKQQIELLKNQNKGYLDELANLGTSNSEFKDKYNDLKNKYDKLEETSKLKLKEMQSIITEQENNLLMLNEKEQNDQNQIHELESQLNLLTNKNENLNNVIKTKDKYLENSKNSYMLLNEENEELRQQNLIKTKMIDNLKNEKDMKIKELSDDILKREKEYLKLQKELVMKDEEFDNIEKECEYQISLKEGEIESIRNELNQQIEELKLKLKESK